MEAGAAAQAGTEAQGLAQQENVLEPSHCKPVYILPQQDRV